MWCGPFELKIVPLISGRNVQEQKIASAYCIYQGTVNVPYGEYKISIFNTGDVKALGRIKIADKWAPNEGGIIIPSKSAIAIERYVIGGNLNAGPRLNHIPANDAIVAKHGVTGNKIIATLQFEDVMQVKHLSFSAGVGLTRTGYAGAHGNTSTQKFEYGTIGNLEDQTYVFEITILNMLPESQYNLKNCIQCNAPLNTNVNYCPTCGVQQPNCYCRICGNIINANDKYCGRCGAAQVKECSACGMTIQKGHTKCSCGNNVSWE